MKKLTLKNFVELTESELKAITPADEIATRELELYIDNNYSLYQLKNAYILNYEKKIKKDNFNYSLGVKGLLNLVNEGIKKYNIEFGGMALNTNDKIYLASEILIDILASMEV